MKKKLCFVVQRYGVEINGGAEAYTRIYAEKLAKIYDVTAVSTCALDYQEWIQVCDSTRDLHLGEYLLLIRESQQTTSISDSSRYIGYDKRYWCWFEEWKNTIIRIHR